WNVTRGRSAWTHSGARCVGRRWSGLGGELGRRGGPGLLRVAPRRSAAGSSIGYRRLVRAPLTMARDVMAGHRLRGVPGDPACLGVCWRAGRYSGSKSAAKAVYIPVILECDGLTVAARSGPTLQPALRDCSFRVSGGEIVGVIGPARAGK